MEKVTGIFNNILKKKKSNLMTKIHRIDTVKNPSSKNDDIYLMIDEKNSLNEMDEYYFEKIEHTFEGYKANESKKLESTNKIMNQFFEKTFSKFDDIFALSQSIAKQISKNQKIEKDLIEEKLNLFIRNNNKYKYNSLELNLNLCKSFAIILSYAYSKMSDYKIKNMKKLVEIRKSIIKKKIDIFNDYNRYKQNNKNEKITKFCKENRNKYEILPEIIFIINRFSLVDTIKIEIMNIYSGLNELNEEYLQYFELTILNIYWLFNSLNTIHFNFIDANIQNSLYLRYKEKIMDDLKELFKENKQTLKMNNLNIKDNLYKNKWDFNDKFKFNNYKNSSNQSLSTFTHKSIDLTNKSERLVGSKTVTNSKRNLFFDFTLLKKLDVKETPTRFDIVKNNISIFKYILIGLYSLNNSEELFNLELIMNDCYIFEFILAFKKIYDMEWMTRNYSEFHLFDIILYNNIMNRINRFNIEFNSLDPVTFDKLLNFLYYNHTITAFNLSLFSAEVSYLTPFIYKIYEGSYNANKLLKEFNEDDTYLFNDYKDLEEKMINYLSIHFINHMQILFHLIKKKKNLEELGFNFDIPSNIVNKPKFMIIIFKFILNILFYVSNTRIKKFCLISPNTPIDCRTDPEINHLINNINYNNNNSLEELSFHMPFYQVLNINIFITPNLKILNVGDVDILTLKLLCKNICNDNFNRKSSLEKLTIGIINSITDLNFDLKLIFEKLFRIKIKNFVYLCLYTNIEIISKYQYFYLLRLLDNNWIPEYRITFNKSSNAIISEPESKKELKKIYYLIPHKMEENCLEDVDIIKIKEYDKKNILIQNINKNVDINDESYWLLKYLFEHVYTDNLKNDQRIKKMIFDILKYAYFIKNPKVIHN